MLFDIAALLVTSGHLGLAAEAPVVPERASIVVTLTVADHPDRLAATDAPPLPTRITAADPVAVGGGKSTVQRRLMAVSGTGLLAELGRHSADELAAYVRSDPANLRDLLATPPAPRVVAGWWSGLDRSSRMAVMSGAPGVVGNLEGVPFSVRNTANRSYLDIQLESLDAQLQSDAGRGESARLQQGIDALRAVDAALGDSRSVPQRYLLSLDGEGRTAAIAVGNPQTADYVSVLVPGMFFGVTGQIDDWTDIAARLYDEQTSWLRLFDRADGSVPGDGDDVAAIAWMGYQTPSLLNVGSLDLAYEGRDEITELITGLQTVRAADQPYVSVLAHSYGSTAALMALTEERFQVDALALIGSPGSDAQSVDELHVRGGNVFVGEAAWDPIPNSAYFGSDPGAAEYGARPMSVAGGVDAITNEVLAASVGHNEYFGPGTESLRNLALIGIDREEFVTDGSDHDVTRTLAGVRR
ncbi:alpha/beta hydrolase family protein [Diaminobutyricimonas aerilata]|uniref:Alpha/beta hydrolase family protein n=1 Tax=Diaminobutyricimonas aerilata TaxID=1162967 RepID=A0A2M9CIW2_9MICO|nr:alpha/beta hydrolase [Diaminobutyricimonas aerilata]PJJ71808.1 alpha/beta hydrolase family protein [Diaminobutyricimonas aerilata]